MMFLSLLLLTPVWANDSTSTAIANSTSISQTSSSSDIALIDTSNGVEVLSSSSILLEEPPAYSSAVLHITEIPESSPSVLLEESTRYSSTTSHVTKVPESSSSVLVEQSSTYSSAAPHISEVPESPSSTEGSHLTDRTTAQLASTLPGTSRPSLPYFNPTAFRDLSSAATASDWRETSGSFVSASNQDTEGTPSAKVVKESFSTTTPGGSGHVSSTIVQSQGAASRSLQLLLDLGTSSSSIGSSASPSDTTNTSVSHRPASSTASVTQPARTNPLTSNTRANTTFATPTIIAWSIPATITKPPISGSGLAYASNCNAASASWSEASLSWHKSQQNGINSSFTEARPHCRINDQDCSYLSSAYDLSWSNKNVLTISLASPPAFIVINEKTTSLDQPGLIFHGPPTITIHGETYTATSKVPLLEPLLHEPTYNISISGAFNPSTDLLLMPGGTRTATWDRAYNWKDMKVDGEQTVGQVGPHCRLTNGALKDSCAGPSKPNCTIVGESVELIYFPPPPRTRNTYEGYNRDSEPQHSHPHKSTMFHGRTFWSDSVYLMYSTLAAIRECGASTEYVGNVYTSAILELASSEVSSLCGYTYATRTVTTSEWITPEGDWKREIETSNSFPQITGKPSLELQPMERQVEWTLDIIQTTISLTSEPTGTPIASVLYSLEFSIEFSIDFFSSTYIWTFPETTYLPPIISFAPDAGFSSTLPPLVNPIESLVETIFDPIINPIESFVAALPPPFSIFPIISTILEHTIVAATPTRFNFYDLIETIPTEAYMCVVEYNATSSSLEPIKHVASESYFPRLSIPVQVRHLDPSWAECAMEFEGSFDPPIALGSASVSVDATPIEDQPSPAPTPGDSVQNPAAITPAPNVPEQPPNDGQPSAHGSEPVTITQVGDVAVVVNPSGSVILVPTDNADGGHDAQSQTLQPGGSPITLPGHMISLNTDGALMVYTPVETPADNPVETPAPAAPLTAIEPGPSPVAWIGNHALYIDLAHPSVFSLSESGSGADDSDLWWTMPPEGGPITASGMVFSLGTPQNPSNAGDTPVQQLVVSPGSGALPTTLLVPVPVADMSAAQTAGQTSASLIATSNNPIDEIAMFILSGLGFPPPSIQTPSTLPPNSPPTPTDTTTSSTEPSTPPPSTSISPTDGPIDEIVMFILNGLGYDISTTQSISSTLLSSGELGDAEPTDAGGANGTESTVSGNGDEPVPTHTLVADPDSSGRSGAVGRGVGWGEVGWVICGVVVCWLWGVL